jgi:DNA-binding MurR/RpiR family transcriptional regulator
MTVIGMTGTRGSRFAALCDLALVTPSDVTPRIQEGHIAMGHTLCELAERALFPSAARGAAARPSRARRAAVRPVRRATSRGRRRAR